MSRFIPLVIAVSGAAFFAPGVIGHIASRFPETLSPAENQCVIKGNISINSGERIYHVPGQEFYNPTKISPQYGERWFCSEAEARAAGWRKAKR